jgi:NAD(P)-dependent dehydrogenase (short-subunit alcohol dehydrogenase family)
MGNSAARFDQASIEDQLGTTFIITGANAGLGFECAKMLAKKNGRVVLACRTVSKGEAAMQDIKAEAPAADLAVYELDVSNLQSIDSFVGKFIANEKCEKLVLINNAGVMAPPLTKTPDGREIQWATNCDGSFMLTAKLFPTFKSKAQARVVFVSSVGHKTPESEELIMEDVDCHSKTYDGFKIYGSTKLGNNLFALGLTRRLATHGVSNVKIVACHPGFAATSIQANAGIGFTTAFAQKAEYGALCLFAAAVDPALESGAYVAPEFKEFSGAPKAGGQYSEMSLRVDLQDKFWELECKRMNLMRTWPAGSTLMEISKRAPPTPICRTNSAEDNSHPQGFVYSAPQDTAAQKEATSNKTTEAAEGQMEVSSEKSVAASKTPVSVGGLELNLSTKGSGSSGAHDGSHQFSVDEGEGGGAAKKPCCCTIA